MHANTSRSTATTLVALALATFGNTIACGQAAAPRSASPGAQAPASAATGPVRVEPAVAKLGKVQPNSTTSATFRLTNTTAAPLRVANAIPSCKCTAISEVIGKIIGPGETIEMKAALKAPPTPGERDAKVFVSFDGVKNPVVVTLVGDVEMPIIAEPAFVDALKGVTKGTIAVRSQDGTPFRIVSAGGKPLSGAAAASHSIAWDLADRAASNTLPIWWVIETDRPDCPLIPLRVRNENTGSKWDMARFERQWHVKDQIVFVPSLVAGKPTEVTIELEHYNPRKAPVLANWAANAAVQSKVPDVKVELIEAKSLSAEAAELRVRLTPAAGTTGSREGGLVVSTATGSADVPFVVRIAP
jgi:hypothetical protein